MRIAVRGLIVLIAPAQLVAAVVIGAILGVRESWDDLCIAWRDPENTRPAKWFRK